MSSVSSMKRKHDSTNNTPNANASSSESLLKCLQIQQSQLQQQEMNSMSFWKVLADEVESIDPLKEDFLGHQELKPGLIKNHADKSYPDRKTTEEAAIVLARACEIFLMDIAMKGYRSKTDISNSILQRKDIFNGVIRADEYDFLADDIKH